MHIKLIISYHVGLEDFNKILDYVKNHVKSIKGN